MKGIVNGRTAEEIRFLVSNRTGVDGEIKRCFNVIDLPAPMTAEISLDRTGILTRSAQRPLVGQRCAASSLNTVLHTTTSVLWSADLQYPDIRRSPLRSELWFFFLEKKP